MVKTKTREQRAVAVNRRPPRGVPRDEWLLAIGLANHGTRKHADYVKHGFIHWVAAWVKDAPLVCDESGFWQRADDSDELAAMRGASDATRHQMYAGWNETDCGNPAAYAAGAAIAIDLEVS